MISNTCLAIVPTASRRRPGQQLGRLRGRDRARSMRLAEAVERAEQVDATQLAACFGLAPGLEQRLEPARRLDLGGQHRGVVGRDPQPS